MYFKRGHRGFIIGSAAPAVKGRNFRESEKKRIKKLRREQEQEQQSGSEKK